MILKLSEIATAVGGVLTGNDRTVTDIVTDNREVKKEGTLFCAIRGERIDGHTFVRGILSDPSNSALIDNPAYKADGTVLVNDTTGAIAEIGEYCRLKRIPDAKVVSVTGSVGKTTTKEMIYCAVSSLRSFRSPGNRNSKISAPLTMSAAPDDVEVVVSELGMSEKGEMVSLSRVVRPDICVITNIGSSHIEQLGSRENIRDEKLSITSFMREGATLILNADDRMLADAKRCENTLYFGIENARADFRAEDIYDDGTSVTFTVCHGETRKNVTIHTVGVHNVLNALAAFAVGTVLGISPDAIAEGLARFVQSGVRQNVYMKRGIRVIADCYNASPESMKAALSVLSSSKGRKIAVLGDMLELGTYAVGLHSQLGEAVRDAKADVLLCYGDFSGTVCDSFGGGTPFELERRDEFVDAVRSTLREGDTVLFKASNRLRFADIITAVGLEE